MTFSSLCMMCLIMSPPLPLSFLSDSRRPPSSFNHPFYLHNFSLNDAMSFVGFAYRIMGEGLFAGTQENYLS